jgi:hypothetical protein
MRQVSDKVDPHTHIKQAEFDSNCVAGWLHDNADVIRY